MDNIGSCREFCQFSIEAARMAIPTARLIHDQNIDIHYNAGASLGGKTDVSKAQKKGGGGLGGRKALNDISNSGKPSAQQASKKHYSSNVISIGKDLGVSKTPFSIGGKSNVAKASEKKQVGGRKALTDLTNTEKPSLQQVSKKSQDKKLRAIKEEIVDSAVKEQAFLHNHNECINSQRKTMDKEYFFEAVGLGHESPFAALPESSKLKPVSSPLKHLAMEEMPVEPIEVRAFKCDSKDFLGYSSPACGSPISAKSPYTSWKQDNFPNFTLIETPKLPRR